MWLALLGSSYFWLRVLSAIWLLSFLAACFSVLYAVVKLSWITSKKRSSTITTLSLPTSPMVAFDLWKPRKENYGHSADY